jgi:hypothetical protein
MNDIQIFPTGTEQPQWVLQTELWLPRRPDDVFPYFADAGNLQELTPDWLHFVILTPLPVEMRAGTLLDYRLRLHRIPIRWRTEITVWEPPHRFVDSQLRGPYRAWIHEHTFERSRGGTLVRDRVTYAVPGGRLINGWLVEPDLRRIFTFRRDVMVRRFAGTSLPDTESVDAEPVPAGSQPV